MENPQIDHFKPFMLRLKTLFALRIIALVVTFSAIPPVAKAQEITMEQTLTYINSKIGPIGNIDVIRGVIIAKFTEGVDIYREDQVLCKSLDLNSMGYDANQKVFYINCNGTSKCVDRQLFMKKIQRDYARLSFPATLDAKSVAGMKKAFTHMIKLVLDPKYESSEPFE